MTITFRDPPKNPMIPVISYDEFKQIFVITNYMCNVFHLSNLPHTVHSTLRLILLFFLIPLLFIGCSSEPKSQSTEAQTAEPNTSEAKAMTHATGDTVGNKNNLQYASSPYLLMHADNPVNWYRWGDKAFQKARKQNKPIFLSIGYSTCYWCHVMERKVFMDPDIAKKMNKYFINIKMDREQHPDVDRIYMKAVRIMTGGGGWPMSVFLTPDLKPFFGATYIPPESRGRRPGFSELSDRMNTVWRNQRDMVRKQAEKVTQRIQQTAATDLTPTNVESTVFQTAFSSIKDRFDSQYGGFGKGQKFPQASNIEFLLNYHKDSGSDQALEMASFTLNAMKRGGIYDHIGEGFHRYATDRKWRVPHFEKMLYNQAQLANIYLKAYQISDTPSYRHTAENILNFTKRMFYHPEGGFYSALNAESPTPENPKGEAKEGAYYTWTYERISELLNEQQTKIFTYVYGVKENGNVEKDPRGEFTGENILYKAHTTEEASQNFDIGKDRVKTLLSKSEQTLFEARQKRPRPFLDDKIVLSWNGLMVSAYANGYKITGKDEYAQIAEKSANFLIEHMYDPESKSMDRRFRNGKVGIDANLTDYAYFVKGLLDLYEATDKQRWLNYARTFTDQQIELFYDKGKGGFYDSRMAGESLLFQTKGFRDGARPSGNSVAVNNLARLYKITGKQDYLAKAEQTMKYFGTYLNQRPGAMPNMLSGIRNVLDVN